MFESSLLTTRRRSKARLLVIPVAIAGHAAVLAGVAVGQYWTVDPVAEPSIQVSFVSGPALPAPPGPPAGPPRATESKSPRSQQPVEMAATDVQPIAIPDQVSKAPDVREIVASSGSVDGSPHGVPHGAPNGVANGRPYGVPWGVPQGVPHGRGVAGTGEILDVRGDVIKPVVLERVQPMYTEPARRARIQGTVIVETIIDASGRVTDARVVKPLPMGLSESALEAVRRWRFEPATLNGRPVSVYFTLHVRFELQ